MKFLAIAILAILPCFVFSQWGVSFHQSNLPFVGVNYEFKNKLRTELRVGVDYYFEDVSVEGVLTYDFKKTQDYEIYAGLGVRVNSNSGAGVIPVGVNFYPFPVKKFGFHIELAPILEEGAVLRGSWGLRYRFL